jgi:hypothetical protein
MSQRKNPLASSSARPSFAPVPMLLTAREASLYVGIGLFDLYRKTTDPESGIKAVIWGKGGRNLRWRKSDLDAYIASLPVSNGPVRSRPGTRRQQEPAAS